MIMPKTVVPVGHGIPTYDEVINTARTKAFDDVMKLLKGDEWLPAIDIRSIVELAKHFDKRKQKKVVQAIIDLKNKCGYEYLLYSNRFMKLRDSGSLFVE